ncbi:hypothetical protein A6V39_02080 [Candidatus Mycoplasma haematobovis]|uniref:Uncharacterized protein n=1 Tax=Candidatus Mycoplasma haematobovis TaxID=432608 RepID=A0A1A9QDP4_9MOLU|nr:sigma-70 family RNA polymerase sigma factor [Candidatus Mycoplasma haematobovis]OAL10214.1 hypothetical protein A6V39_02080 [Candidatus Mycoplasma haematobovis]
MSGLEKLIALAQAGDKEATQKLLEMYYFEACRWACKFITKLKHSNLIQFEHSEIDSFVYIAFVKTVKQYSLNREKIQSFKNFFYQMIKYQSYEELRTTFNWQVIPNYEKFTKQYMQEQENKPSEEEMFENKFKCKKIIAFLSKKCKLYADIFECKLLGYKNNEICDKLKISKSTLKSTSQYIKKLIREEFGQFGELL